MIDTIIFDLGGVLVDWNPQYLYRKLFKSQEAVDFFLNNICTSAWNEEHDGGKLVAVGTNEKTREFPHFKNEIEAFYERWDEMIGGVIQPTANILANLKQTSGYRLLALTNWSAEKWPYALDNFDFLNHFEGILVSGQEKLKKPDHAIYKLILSRYDVRAEHAVFIDDNKRNILAAKEVGLNAIHFTNPEALTESLKELGI